MIEKRNTIIKNIFNHKSEKIVRVPVAFNYIIQNIIGQQGINSNSLVDITMLEAFNIIENTYKQLEKIVFAPPTELFKVLFYYYLYYGVYISLIRGCINVVRDFKTIIYY